MVNDLQGVSSVLQASQVGKPIENVIFIAFAKQLSVAARGSRGKMDFTVAIKLCLPVTFIIRRVRVIASGI